MYRSLLSLLLLSQAPGPTRPLGVEDFAARLEAARAGDDALRELLARDLLAARPEAIPPALALVESTDAWLVPSLELLARRNWDDPVVDGRVPEAVAQVLFDRFPQHATEVGQRVVVGSGEPAVLAFSTYLEAMGLGTPVTRSVLTRECREVQTAEQSMRVRKPRWGFLFVTLPRQNRVLVAHVCADSSAEAGGLEAPVEIVAFAGVRGATKIQKEVLVNSANVVTLWVRAGEVRSKGPKAISLRRKRTAKDTTRDAY